MVWSVGAVVMGVLAWRGVRWAATGLIVSAGIAGGICLLVIVGSFLLLLPLVGCAATVALLLRPEARRWYAGALMKNEHRATPPGSAGRRRGHGRSPPPAG